MTAFPAGMPAALAPLARSAAGAAWLRRVPDLLARARERWGLETTEPFQSGSAAWTCRARRKGDVRWDLVLKLSYPHDEAAREADALLHWHGHGAPVLLDHDGEDWALLMRAVSPGTALAGSALPTDRALRAGGRALAELHAAPAPGLEEFPDLEATLAEWGALVAERAAAHSWAPTDPDLVACWPDTVARLLAAPHRRVLLHGDANPGNLLASEEGQGARWVAIDPKALVGDPAFDPWPLIEQIAPDPFALPEPAAELDRRAHLLAHLLGTSAWAILGWGFVRRAESVLWLTNLLAAQVADAPGPARPEAHAELVRQWQETRAWQAAFRRADPPEVAA